MKKQILLAAVAFAGILRAQADDADVRARQIVSQMTLLEKITELHGVGDKEHKRYVPGIPRLGIPPLIVANGPCGVGPGDEPKQLPATALPAPISLAATWDPALAKSYGVIIGKEALDLHDTLLEGPDINIARVPQNGRTFEAFGEDPFLVGRLSVAEIQGIQSQGEIANVKHYAANNQESGRLTINEIIDERTLREIYLPAFEASIVEGHSASIMSAYPRVNGHFCSENNELLDQILKKEWNFQGFITSDFGAVHSTVPSALATLDLEMPDGKYFDGALAAAVESNEVPVTVIDDKLVRRFRTMIQFGFFDHPQTMSPIPADADGAESRRIAEEGMVLLKNDGDILPVDEKKLHSIAVIGPFAAKAMTGGGGSSHIIPIYTVEPVAGIQTRAGAGVKISFDGGEDISNAVALAKSADVAIVMVGDREGEDHDHPLSLTNGQDELVEAVAAANPHTVVVLKTGSVILMPWVDKVSAILEAWYPGEEDGNAVAAVLFGDVNPSGKLPLTFPKQLSDLSANTPEQYPGVNGAVKYSEGVFVGYRHYDAKNIEPLFPFGFGLSYTKFVCKNLAISTDKIFLKANSSPMVTVDFDVANTGKRAGEETVELYVGLPATASVPQPPKQLKGFSKISLAPGQTRHVQLQLDARALSYWNTANHDWEILPGSYRVMAGGSSRDLPLQGAFTVSAD
ncbi:MAG TPA: glycoside hydrolase family 3 C-terminal domain-containing protein [Methylomirabilota bacterium]|nr:glycoside hydrolase family 3 C-terminal domain-containing protein [Methylomirabilota bacterium]